MPKGFQKVRYYGLFSSSQRPRLALAQRLLGLPAATETTTSAPANSRPDPPVFRCPTCGRPMRQSQTLRRSLPGRPVGRSP
ncbi:MAG: hypothetical protein AB1801_06945 [Chloroflexota bacterium]